MAVRELRSQEVQHDSGAILRSAGREAMQLEFNGHTLTIDVDRGVGRDLFYLSLTPWWDDGTEVPAAFAQQIPSIISEIEKFWGSEAEFCTLSR
jgi:hypothetical protein